MVWVFVSFKYLQYCITYVNFLAIKSKLVFKIFIWDTQKNYILNFDPTIITPCTHNIYQY